MPVAGPGREHQQEPGVLGGGDLVALRGIEHGQQAGAALGLVAVGERRSARVPRSTSTQARSWTWCSCSRSPAGRLITIARPSSSESSTTGFCGSTSISDRSQLRISLLASAKAGLGCRPTLSSAAMVIAIDGPAGAGKSTVARALAERARLHLPRLGRDVSLRRARRRCAPAPTSTTRRSVGELAEAARIDLEPAERVSLDGEDVSEAIRAPEISAAASRVSVHPRVRAAMVERQRDADRRRPTTWPRAATSARSSARAPLKVFLTASAEERADRRAAETGEHSRDVLEAQATRDERDREREHGALRPAERRGRGRHHRPRRRPTSSTGSRPSRASGARA